jgi:hypothetical protein
MREIAICSALLTFSGLGVRKYYLAPREGSPHIHISSIPSCDRPSTRKPWLLCLRFCARSWDAYALLATNAAFEAAKKNTTERYANSFLLGVRFCPSSPAKPTTRRKPVSRAFLELAFRTGASGTEKRGRNHGPMPFAPGLTFPYFTYSMAGASSSMVDFLHRPEK